MSIYLHVPTIEVYEAEDDEVLVKVTRLGDWTDAHDARLCLDTPGLKSTWRTKFDDAKEAMEAAEVLADLARRADTEIRELIAEHHARIHAYLDRSTE